MNTRSTTAAPDPDAVNRPETYLTATGIAAALRDLGHQVTDQEAHAWAKQNRPAPDALFGAGSKRPRAGWKPARVPEFAAWLAGDPRPPSPVPPVVYATAGDIAAHLTSKGTQVTGNTVAAWMSRYGPGGDRETPAAPLPPRDAELEASTGDKQPGWLEASLPAWETFTRARPMSTASKAERRAAQAASKTAARDQAARDQRREAARAEAGQREAFLGPDAPGLPRRGVMVTAVWDALGVTGGQPDLAADLHRVAAMIEAGTTPDDALAGYPRLAVAWRALDQWAPAIDVLMNNDESAAFLGIGGPSLTAMRVKKWADGRPAAPPLAKRIGKSPAHTPRLLVLHVATMAGRGGKARIRPGQALNPAGSSAKQRQSRAAARSGQG